MNLKEKIMRGLKLKLLNYKLLLLVAFSMAAVVPGALGIVQTVFPDLIPVIMWLCIGVLIVWAIEHFKDSE